ncbi:DUF6141 family protein [Methanogenium marinum]|uniref:DUF6141 family protein n=1 Tax=Methanogenium marinum TaxID=348610 RepID=A0A9Q4PYJ3_9EURY|nr:DUF6141 family protein [Methanogenium marinum]MDE4908082.1 DUF6141 family protein [Methanogenium marinum]
MRDGVLFSEVQWFRTQGLVMIVWFGALLIWYGFYLQIVAGVPFGDNPGPDWLMWVLLVAFGIGMPVFFLLLRLETEVVDGCLSYRMYPVHLQFRVVACHEIAAVEAISYRPLRDYGGWGIRRGKMGPAYTVSGNQGVRISLVDGTSLLIGSQRADELAVAIFPGIMYEKRASSV